MAQTVSVDDLGILSADERNGALRRLVRRARIEGIVATDWQQLTKALDDANLPADGSFLTNSGSDNAFDLVLVERNVSTTDKGQVIVDLVYENFVDIEENLDQPRGGYAIGEVRCNIQQKTSNLDINGDQVTVQHTYPGDDPNFPGETLTQGGEFQYYDPERSVIVRGKKVTRTPWNIANKIIGRVNSVPWGGELARYWLCTACSWRLQWAGRVGGSGTRDNEYLFDFEFQYNPDTWDPTIYYVDTVTNRPPPNLVVGVGIKTIEKQEAVSFDDVIGVPIQGG